MLAVAVGNEGEKTSTGPVSGAPMIEWQSRYFLSASPGFQPVDFPPGTWELLGSFAAAQRDQYIYRASTRANRTESSTPYSVYAISAHTTRPSLWFMSPPDSGYSIDNLAPGVPRGISGVYDHAPDFLTVSWQPNAEPDLSHYNVYWGVGRDHGPLDSLVATTENTMVSGLELFPTDPSYVKVSATDIHGNESEVAVLEYVAVATLVTSYEAVWKRNAVEVSWVMSHVATDVVFEVSRKSGASGSYEDLVFNIAQDGNQFVFFDTSVERGQTYSYRVTIMQDGAQLTSFVAIVTTPSLRFALGQNRPNPFNPATSIPFSLDRDRSCLSRDL